MSDLRVRDHSQPCEHGYTGVSHAVDANNVVVSGPQGFNWCPGGREIVLRERQLRDFFAGWPPDQTVYVVEEA